MDKKSKVKNDPLQILGSIIDPERVEEIRPRVGRPKKEPEEPTTERATFIVDRELLKKFKDWAWTDRLSITDAINTMMSEYLSGKQIMDGRPDRPKRTWHKKGTDND